MVGSMFHVQLLGHGTQHTTYNIQHTTHNIQYQPSTITGVVPISVEDDYKTVIINSVKQLHDEYE